MLRYLGVFAYSPRECNTPPIYDQASRVLELVREAGVLRPRDLEPLGIPRTYLSRLHNAGCHSPHQDRFVLKVGDAVRAEIILDVDATDDPVHRHQEGRFFHGYYRHYCYLPLHIFCG